MELVIIGKSDAKISAALGAREVAPIANVMLLSMRTLDGTPSFDKAGFRLYILIRRFSASRLRKPASGKQEE